MKQNNAALSFIDFFACKERDMERMNRKAMPCLRGIRMRVQTACSACDARMARDFELGDECRQNFSLRTVDFSSSFQKSEEK